MADVTALMARALMASVLQHVQRSNPHGGQAGHHHAAWAALNADLHSGPGGPSGSGGGGPGGGGGGGAGHSSPLSLLRAVSFGGGDSNDPSIVSPEEEEERDLWSDVPFRRGSAVRWRANLRKPKHGWQGTDKRTSVGVVRGREADGTVLVEFPPSVGHRTRTRTKTHPYGTKNSAVRRSVRACVTRKSKAVPSLSGWG